MLLLKNIVYTALPRNYSSSRASYPLVVFHLRCFDRKFSAEDGDKLPSNENAVKRESDGKNNNVWSWVPPKRLHKDQVLKDNFVIPCIPGVFLTPDEVKAALISQGAEDVTMINLKGRLGNISEFVLGTGRSTRHLRKMAESIVSAMKSRNVKQPKETEGIEGKKNDDWQLVDCNTFLVHLMLPATRKAIDLEAHWSQEEMPILPYNLNDAAYEVEFERLLDKYPCPEDYLKEDEERVPELRPSKVRKL